MTTHTNSSNETFISLTGCSRGTLISSTSSASLFALCPPQTPFQPPPLIAFPSTISTHNQQQEEEKEKEPEQQQINNSTTVQRCHSAPSIFERQTYSDVRRPSCPVILQISSSTSTSSFAIDMTPTKDIWHLWRIRPKRSLATVVRTEFASVLKCIGGVLLYALICAAPVSAYIIPATKYVYVPYHNTDNERHVAYFLVDSIPRRRPHLPDVDRAQRLRLNQLDDPERCPPKQPLDGDGRFEAQLRQPRLCVHPLPCDGGGVVGRPTPSRSARGLLLVGGRRVEAHALLPPLRCHENARRGMRPSCSDGRPKPRHLLALEPHRERLRRCGLHDVHDLTQND
eukprot:PhM_4_TR472/c1_g1_i6/m.27491